MNRVCFSVNRYDEDGDELERGIFIHFGDTMVKVAENIEEFEEFQKNMESIKEEIRDNGYRI